jgi:AcrR family transcriptional regulator
MASRTSRAEQVSATRESLLAAAERLFAERGVHAVATRQISEAAGHGNNAAVNYHFGTKVDLIRAIAHRHAEQMEVARTRMLADIGDSTDLRDWVACLVHSVTGHLEALGSPTWYARFIAQVAADPALHALLAEEILASGPSLRSMVDGLSRCLPDLPVEVHAERAAMARHMIVQISVDRERALADSTPTLRTTWHATATGLVDAIVALWQAPVTPGA